MDAGYIRRKLNEKEIIVRSIMPDYDSRTSSVRMQWIRENGEY